MDLKRSKLFSPRLELTPLVDVVFLLLTFYMLTSTFTKDEGIPLALPSASTAQAQLDQVLILSLINDQMVQADGKDIAVKDLKEFLAFRISQDKGVVIRSGKEASVQTFVSVLDEVRKSGAVNVTIATDRE